MGGAFFMRAGMVWLSLILFPLAVRAAWLNEAPVWPTMTPAEGAIIPSEKSDLTVDTSNRAAVAAFYRDVYEAAEGIAPYWTGDTDTCDAGTTADAYRDATLLRINYYRAMAGLPASVNSDSRLNAKCQEAALMMAANNNLSHNPPESWSCYSEEGADAAGHSNIALGAAGPDAIDLYIADYGAHNTALGHRRWVLYPPLRTVGTGSVYWANALWVIYPNGWEDTLLQSAWPPAGYVPYAVAFPRWSFSYPGADFSSASVEMYQGNNAVDLTLLPPASGYGDNTLGWEPTINLFNTETDTAYRILIKGVRINQQSRDFEYTVTLFNPDLTPEEGETTEEGESEGEMEGEGEDPILTVEAAAQALQEAFASADTNGDDELSLEEAQGSLTQLSQDLFNTIDSDGNSRITYEELTAVTGESSWNCQCISLKKPLSHKSFPFSDWLCLACSLGVLLWLHNASR